MFQDVPITAITIGPRFRKDLGDIAALAESIERIGLLHPIIVTTDYALVVGRRRLEAHKNLGRTTIEAQVIDLDDPLAAEVDENEKRKDYTISEWIGIGEARKERDEANAKARLMEGRKRGGRGKKKLSVDSTESLEVGEARDITARHAGMGWQAYQRAKAVVKAAEDDPIFQPLVETMDRTGKVATAWKRLPEDLRQPMATTSKPKAAPIFTIETILNHFDRLFHRCAPSFHRLDEEGVEQVETLFAYFLEYIKAEAQGVVHGLDQH